MSKKLVGELLKGRVALVTGSSTGIGIGILRQLAAGGATTVMHGLEPEAALQQKAATIAAQYGTIVGTNSANLLHPQEVRDMIARVQEEFGRLDILVNNAGIQHVAPVHEFPEEKWNAVCGAALGSMHALVASPFKSAYNAAKHGVAGLTKTVALEVATKGVTVNAVCPGYVMTELIEKQLASQAKTRGIPKEKVISDVLLVDQPIKRFVKSEEVGALVRHLCTDDAAAITGACLSIDGGWTAR
ncbi:D-beta-hydroxybutyrate dehydrogenase [Chlorella vulgaris]